MLSWTLGFACTYHVHIRKQTIYRALSHVLIRISTMRSLAFLQKDTQKLDNFFVLITTAQTPQQRLVSSMIVLGQHCTLNKIKQWKSIKLIIIQLTLTK